MRPNKLGYKSQIMGEPKMIKKKWVILVSMAITIGCTAVSLNAQDVRTDPGFEAPPFERVGQTGWQFLRLPAVARNAALANVKSGLADNTVAAIFTNPAKLVDIGNVDAAFSLLTYVADISYMTGAVAKNLGNWGVFGFHFANLDAGDMYRTENVLDEDLGITVRSGDIETFTAGDLLVGVSYARSMTDRLSIGGNISYIRENLDETEVTNWNADFGIFFRTGFRSLTLSMLARNFGPDTEFAGFTEIYDLPQTVRMPLDFRLGVSYGFIEGTSGLHELRGYLEGAHPNDGPERVHAAMEYTLLNIFSLRGGYKFNYDEQGLTLGGGLNFSMAGVTGRIDYAFLDYGRLSSVHLFTVGFGLGK